SHALSAATPDRSRSFPRHGPKGRLAAPASIRIVDKYLRECRASRQTVPCRGGRSAASGLPSAVGKFLQTNPFLRKSDCHIIRFCVISAAWTINHCTSRELAEGR